jgi:hypothetical protein
MRASYRLRAGRAKLTVWPRSLPWLLEIGRRQWWLLDRGQNLACLTKSGGRGPINRKGRR